MAEIDQANRTIRVKIVYYAHGYFVGGVRGSSAALT